MTKCHEGVQNGRVPQLLVFLGEKEDDLWLLWNYPQKSAVAAPVSPLLDATQQMGIQGCTCQHKKPPGWQMWPESHRQTTQMQHPNNPKTTWWNFLVTKCVETMRLFLGHFWVVSRSRLGWIEVNFWPLLSHTNWDIGLKLRQIVNFQPLLALWFCCSQAPAVHWHVSKTKRAVGFGLPNLSRLVDNFGQKSKTKTKHAMCSTNTKTQSAFGFFALTWTKTEATKI